MYSISLLKFLLVQYSPSTWHSLSLRNHLVLYEVLRTFVLNGVVASIVGMEDLEARVCRVTRVRALYFLLDSKVEECAIH